jgi:succinate dehydrogenase / fumarate reductase iron-sulfur subunit
MPEAKIKDMEKHLNLKIKVWRQKNANDKGKFEEYPVNNISTDMSFLEMFDVLNEKLIVEGKDPVAFDHDCREGICGSCSMFINGRPHGPKQAVTTCQLHMRSFNDGMESSTLPSN